MLLKNTIGLLWGIFIYGVSCSQAKISVGQYVYVKGNVPVTIVPQWYFESPHHWTLYCNYNYEANQTLSIYVGYSFKPVNTLDLKFRILFGALFGKEYGLSSDVEGYYTHKRVQINTQWQYSSIRGGAGNMSGIGWTEVGYKWLHMITLGMAVQNTWCYRKAFYFEPGFFTGICLGNWTFPIYIIKPFSHGQYAILGVCWDL